MEEWLSGGDKESVKKQSPFSKYTFSVHFHHLNNILTNILVQIDQVIHV